ncbi:hypothetical protein Aab01nite_26570 [Paractinoplanes abujensis]|nr:hypothetical protein Aab01nite_26570 [Actinoplanes abujensis]
MRVRGRILPEPAVRLHLGEPNGDLIRREPPPEQPPGSQVDLTGGQVEPIFLHPDSQAHPEFTPFSAMMNRWG